MHSRVNASLICMRIFFTAALFAALAAAQTKVTTVEGITEYKLDNGLNVLLFPDTSKPTVTVNITYLVGSRYEGYGETGMAHLLEHMLFKGTDTRKDIMPELRNHGAKFNGSTYYDRTNYFETMPATEENLRLALELEADRMIHSRVSRADLDSEMTVVRNEFEMGENSPQRVLLERVMSTAYLWHSYGRSHDRRAQRYRARADRAPAGLLSQVLSARQRDAGRGGKIRRGQDAGLDQGHFRRDSEAHAQTRSRPIPKSRRRTANAK